jgi:hypothetical protein
MPSYVYALSSGGDFTSNQFSPTLDYYFNRDNTVSNHQHLPAGYKYRSQVLAANNRNIDGILLQHYTGTRDDSSILSATINGVTNSWRLSAMYDITNVVVNPIYYNSTPSAWKYLKFANKVTNPGATVEVVFDVSTGNTIAPAFDVEKVHIGSFVARPGVTDPSKTLTNRWWPASGENQGGYYYFDGTINSHLTADKAFAMSTEWYSACWLVDNSSNQWTYHYPYNGNNCGTQNRLVTIVPNNYVGLYVHNACYSSGTMQLSGAVPPTGRWYFLVIQKRNGRTYAYIDGVQCTRRAGQPNYENLNLSTAASYWLKFYNFHAGQYFTGAVAHLSEGALGVYTGDTEDFTGFVPRLWPYDSWYTYNYIYFFTRFNMALVSDTLSSLSAIPNFGANDDVYITKPYYSRESNISNNTDLVSITANVNENVPSIVLDRAELKFDPAKKVTLTLNNIKGLQIQPYCVLSMGTKDSPMLSSGHAVLSGTLPIRLDAYENATISMYGTTKQRYAYLVNDALSGSKSFQTTDDISTNWLPGDTVLFYYNTGGSTFETSIIDTVSPFSFTTRTSINNTVLGINKVAIVPAVYNLTRNARFDSVGGSFSISDFSSAYFVNTEFKNIGTNTIDDQYFNRVYNTANFSLISSVYHSPSPFISAGGTQDMLYLDGGDRSEFLMYDNLFYRHQKRWIVSGLTFRKPSNFSNNFFLCGRAEGFEFSNNRLYHPLYFNNNVAIENGYNGIEMRANTLIDPYVNCNNNIAIGNRYVGATYESNTLSSLSCENFYGNRNHTTNIQIHNNYMYNNGTVYARNISSNNSNVGYGMYIEANRLGSIFLNDSIIIDNAGRGVHFGNHLQRDNTSPQYVNLSGLYIFSNGDRGLYMHTSNIYGNININNLSSIQNLYGLELDGCDSYSLSANNIICNTNRGYALRYANIKSGDVYFNNILASNNQSDSLYFYRSSVSSFGINNAFLSSNVGGGIFIDTLTVKDNLTFTNIYSYFNRANNGVYYYNINCDNFIIDNQIVSACAVNTGTAGGFKIDRLYAKNSIDINNLTVIDNWFVGIDIKNINPRSFKMNNVLVSGGRSNASYGLNVDFISAASLSSINLQNISAINNPSYGSLYDNITSINSVYIKNYVSNFNKGNGFGMYIKKSLSDVNVTLLDSAFISNTGTGCTIHNSFDNKNTSYLYNINSKSNTLNGLSISGSSNYLNPLNLSLFNSYLSSNSYGGLEALNVCGNISATEILDNKNNNIRALIGNGPVLIDSLTSYYNNVVTKNLTGYGNGGLTLSSSSPFPTGNDSLYFNGTNYLVAPASNDYVFNGNFTIEFFINLRNNPGCTYLDQWFGSSGWQIGNNGSKTLQWFYDGTKVLNGPVISLNQWNHIALVRNSNRLGLYVNGLSTTGVFFSGGMGRNDLLYIGAQRYLGPIFFAPMWLSNVRIVNNAALYTTLSFTPPSSKLGSTAGNVAFLYQYPYGIPYTSFLGPATRSNISLSGINYHTFYIKNSKLHDSGFSYFAAPALFFDATNYKQFYIDNSNAGSSQLGAKSMTYGSYTFNNCAFNNIPIQNGLAGLYQPNASKTTGWAYMNYNQTSGYHVTYYANGSRMIDTSIHNDNYVSERLTPTSRTEKLKSASKFVALNNGDTTFISVFIRKSTLASDGEAYNGNPPRLILRRNVSMGIYDDIVLGEYVATSDLFQPIINTTPTVIDDGVLEFYVDCDGTQGWINVDTWSAQ